VLVGTLTGIAVGQTTKLLSHTLQFAVLLAMFTNITQHTLYLCWTKRRDNNHFARFGPAYTVFLATILIMVHPTYTVLRVGKQISSVGSPCFHTMHACTVMGYTLMLVGVVWASGIVEKIQRALGQHDREL